NGHSYWASPSLFFFGAFSVFTCVHYFSTGSCVIHTGLHISGNGCCVVPTVLPHSTVIMVVMSFVLGAGVNTGCYVVRTGLPHGAVAYNGCCVVRTGFAIGAGVNNGRLYLASSMVPALIEPFYFLVLLVFSPYILLTSFITIVSFVIGAGVS
ncbi:21441_t:CDS:2, partial [Gigaspora rosea]